MSGKTEKLIKDIAKRAELITPINPTRRCCIWTILALVIAAVISVAIGIRHDISDKINSGIFIFEIVTALAAGFLAALVASWLSIPGAKQQKTLIWLPFIPITMLFGIAGYQIFLMPVHLSDVEESVHCAADIIMVAAVPAIALFAMLKLAASTRNVLTSIMAVLSVGAFGYLCSRLICPNDEISHVIMWHYLPTLLIASIGAFVGFRILKW